MTYLRRNESDSGLGFFGCGPGCGPGCACGPCRANSSRLGELYIKDDDANEPEAVGDWELAASITADDIRTGARCQADERRITHPTDPPPADVVAIDRRYLTDPGGRPQQLHRAAYAAYINLKRAAEADGVQPNILTIVSAYRSATRQRGLWEAALKKYGSPEKARLWVAPPGGSPHQSGRAIDFYLGTKNNSENIAALRATQGYRWLVCNAARFGFTPYAREPWHWEYNPAGAVAPSAGRVSPSTPTPRPTPPLRRPPAPRPASSPRSRPIPRPAPPPGSALRTLLLNLPGRPRFAYRFTPDDELWATRFIVGEAGGADNPDNRAVLWTMFNRYALFTHRVFPSFAAFIRAYSTPLQPILRSAGAARRHMNRPDFVSAGGNYPPPNQDVPRGQLRRHLDLQKATGNQLPASALALVRRALSGQIANPIGNATEFANTAVYFNDRNRRRPTEDEWRQFTIDFARGKKWTWIGPVHGLDQLRTNAFFVDNRVANLPPNAVRIA
jgi:D-alanyl-D-alanine dipeptidase